MSNGSPAPNLPIDNQQRAMTHPAVIITQMVLQTVTLVFSMYIATLGTRNQEKIERVEERQEHAATRSEEIKRTVETKTAADSAATEIQLWSTWKYLDSLATESMETRDRAKAEDAKKAYESFRSKHNGKN